MDDRSVIHAAPSALFQQIYSVNCDNPFLSAQQVATICTANGLGPTDDASLSIGRRNVEGGARIYDYEHLSYKADPRRPRRPRRRVALRRLRAVRPHPVQLLGQQRHQHLQGPGRPAGRRHGGQPGLPVGQRRLRALQHLLRRRRHA
ncbi:MAG: hypothetical protein WDM92_09325 [Caulobacteraceae bacterium]